MEIGVIHALANLLALLHGDGGQHQYKVGRKQAILDAIELIHTKWVTNEMLCDINELIAERAELRNKVIEIERRIKSVLKASTVHDKISMLEELEQLLKTIQIK